jgi:uncharacterized protein GlcG (DUF336 family)
MAKECPIVHHSDQRTDVVMPYAPGIVVRRGCLASALNAMSGGRVVSAAGGVLIKDGQGVVVGAVGISSDVSDKDEACAPGSIAAAELIGGTV